jgi:hypothetical protein
LPDTAKELRGLLGFTDDGGAASRPWGQGFTPGHKVNAPKVLFPRIEAEK